MQNNQPTDPVAVSPNRQPNPKQQDSFIPVPAGMSWPHVLDSRTILSFDVSENKSLILEHKGQQSLQHHGAGCTEMVIKVSAGHKGL